MILSLNWLKEYLDIPEDLSASALAEKLTVSGFEVVSLKHVNVAPKGLLIGKTLTKQKHPNADTLSLLKVQFFKDAKVQEAMVVCGASNVEANQNIAYASLGCKLPGGLKIGKARIRGQASFGMICSLAELGKEDESETIWVLPETAKIEDPIQSYLGDPDLLFDIEFTSNRTNAMNLVSMAREVAALLELPFANQDIQVASPVLPSKAILEQDDLQVFIEEASLAQRYCLIALDGLQVAASPSWLRQRLYHHGLRSINNVVDITNLVMLEHGQPLHAFDADKMASKRIGVRRAKSGECLTVLGGEKKTLVPDDVVITDGIEPIGFAGVMGGLRSGISQKTTRIYLEAAVFNPQLIKQTIRRHDLYTDSGKRFENGVCSALCHVALQRAVSLYQNLCGASVSSHLKQVFPKPPQPKEVSLTYKKVETLLSLSLTKHISKAFIKKSLSALAFTIKAEDEETLNLEIPIFRNDVQYEWDILEEIARVYGYNAIPEGSSSAVHSSYQNLDEHEPLAAEHAQALGYKENYSYPFTEDAFVEFSAEPLANYLQLQNPTLSNFTLLRRSGLYGLLKALQTNRAKGKGGRIVRSSPTRFFELAHVFIPVTPPLLLPPLPLPPPVEATKIEAPKAGFAAHQPMPEQSLFPECNEIRKMSFLLAFVDEKTFWKDPLPTEDFYTISGDVSSFIYATLPASAKSAIEFQPLSADSVLPNFLSSLHCFDTNESLQVLLAKQPIGLIARVSNKTLRFFGMKSKHAVYFAELNLERLFQTAKTQHAKAKQRKSYTAISIYPSLIRDLAIVVNDAQTMAAFYADIRTAHNFISAVKLTQVYRGKGIAQGKKSCVFRLEFCSVKRTLTREEVDSWMLAIVAKLQKKHSFSLR